MYIFHELSKFSHYKENFCHTEKCTEIIMEECELIPSHIINFALKEAITKKKKKEYFGLYIEKSRHFNFSEIFNHWYYDNNYCLALLKNYWFDLNGNQSQHIFLFYEPKLKNILSKKKLKTKGETMSKLLKIKPGNYFKISDKRVDQAFTDPLNYKTSLRYDDICSDNDGQVFIDVYFNYDEMQFNITPNIVSQCNILEIKTENTCKNFLGKKIIILNQSEIKILDGNKFHLSKLEVAVDRRIEPFSKLKITYQKKDEEYFKYLISIVKHHGIKFDKKFDKKLSINFKKKNFLLNSTEEELFTIENTKEYNLKKKFKTTPSYLFSLSFSENKADLKLNFKLAFISKIFSALTYTFLPILNLDFELEESIYLCKKGLEIYRPLLRISADMSSRLRKYFNFIISFNTDYPVKKRMFSFGLGLTDNIMHFIRFKVGWAGVRKFIWWIEQE